MKLIEDNNGMFLGESRSIPVCSSCGCRMLFKHTSDAMYRLKKCPQCGHMLNLGAKQNKN